MGAGASASGGIDPAALDHASGVLDDAGCSKDVRETLRRVIEEQPLLLHRLSVALGVSEQPKDSGESTGASRTALLPPSLANFVPIAREESVVAIIDEIGDDINELCATLLGDASRAGTAATSAKLRPLADRLLECLSMAVDAKVEALGDRLFDKCAAVALDGMGVFTDVYTSVWDTVDATEPVGDYYQLVSELSASIPKHQRLQRPEASDLVVLYADAAAAKPGFDAALQRVKGRAGRGVELDLTSSLKRMVRAAEKATFAGRDARSCCDVVRAMFRCESMRCVGEVMKLVFSDDALVVTCVKDRFKKEPTGGGWRDLMLSVHLAEDPNRHCCEVQVVHSSMIVARKGLPGHHYYSIGRNAKELITYRHGRGITVELLGLKPFFAKFGWPAHGVVTRVAPELDADDGYDAFGSPPPMTSLVRVSSTASYNENVSPEKAKDGHDFNWRGVHVDSKSGHVAMLNLQQHQIVVLPELKKLLESVVPRLSSLRMLYLDGNRLGDRVGRMIAGWLETNATLELLSATSCDLANATYRALCRVFALNTTLRRLRLGGSNKPPSSSLGAEMGAALTGQFEGRESKKESAELSHCALEDLTFGSTSIPVRRIRKNDITDLGFVNAGREFGDGGVCLVVALLRGTSNSSVSQLSFRGCYIGNDGPHSVIALSQLLEQNNSVEALDISLSSIDVEAVPSLARALRQNNSLTQLNIGTAAEVRNEGGLLLAEALDHNTSLTSFMFGMRGLDLGALLTDRRQRNTGQNGENQMTSIDLSGATLGNAGCAILSHVLRKPTCICAASLTNLNLSSNALGDGGVAMLSEALRCNEHVSLSSLDLSDNAISEDGAIALGNALLAAPLPSLQKLFLASNEVGEAGAHAIGLAVHRSAVGTKSVLPSDASVGVDFSSSAELYQSTELKNLSRNGASGILPIGSGIVELDLGANALGPEGVIALCESLRGRQARTDASAKDDDTGGSCPIVKLSLDRNECGDEGALAIVNAASAGGALASLRMLDLQRNNIGSAIVAKKVVAKLIDESSLLSDMDLSFNAISDDGAKVIGEELSTRSTSPSESKESKTHLKLKLTGNPIGVDSCAFLRGVSRNDEGLYLIVSTYSILAGLPTMVGDEDPNRQLSAELALQIKRTGDHSAPYVPFVDQALGTDYHSDLLHLFPNEFDLLLNSSPSESNDKQDDNSARKKRKNSVDACAEAVKDLIRMEKTTRDVVLSPAAIMNEAPIGWDNPFYIAALGRCNRAKLHPELRVGILTSITCSLPSSASVQRFLVQAGITSIGALWIHSRDPLLSRRLFELWMYHEVSTVRHHCAIAIRAVGHPDFVAFLEAIESPDSVDSECITCAEAFFRTLGLDSSPLLWAFHPKPLSPKKENIQVSKTLNIIIDPKVNDGEHNVALQRFSDPNIAHLKRIITALEKDRNGGEKTADNSDSSGSAARVTTFTRIGYMLAACLALSPSSSPLVEKLQITEREMEVLLDFVHMGSSLVSEERVLETHAVKALVLEAVARAVERTAASAETDNRDGTGNGEKDGVLDRDDVLRARVVKFASKAIATSIFKSVRVSAKRVLMSAKYSHLYVYDCFDSSATKIYREGGFGSKTVRVVLEKHLPKAMLERLQTELSRTGIATIEDRLGGSEDEWWTQPWRNPLLLIYVYISSSRRISNDPTLSIDVAFIQRRLNSSSRLERYLGLVCMGRFGRMPGPAAMMRRVLPDILSAELISDVRDVGMVVLEHAGIASSGSAGEISSRCARMISNELRRLRGMYEAEGAEA